MAFGNTKADVGCLTEITYTGSEAEWNAINNLDAANMANATINFNC